LVTDGSAPALSLRDLLDEGASRPMAVSREIAQEGNSGTDGETYPVHSRCEAVLVLDADLAI
jgi:hypothetical protein